MESAPRLDSIDFEDKVEIGAQAKSSDEMEPAKSPIAIEMDPPTKTEDVQKDVIKMDTLGSIQLRNETGEIILIPTPTDDPNDPLNWSYWYKTYITVITTIAIFECNFLIAGPAVALVQIAETFLGPATSSAEMSAHIQKAAWFFTTSALLQGTGEFFWMPLIVKYGRRPIYVISFSLYVACAAWAGAATTWSSELGARILMGFATGAGECLGPLTIADLWFVHQRGTIMAIYTTSLSMGVALGTLLSGLVTIGGNSWRDIYWVGLSLVGLTTLLVIFTFPESTYVRNTETTAVQQVQTNHPTSVVTDEVRVLKQDGSPQRKESYIRSLRLFHGTYTQESLFKLFTRIVALIILPPVLWASLVMAVTIGFLVAISSNFASAYSSTYGFETWQIGLQFIGAIIGSLVGVWFGGGFSDLVADYFTRRNGGRREPEFRLPAIALNVITGPLALILYGVGIGNKLHWICPTIGMSLLNFSVTAATNISLVYTIDAYRPVAGEITVTQLAFKALFGFLLSFYTNEWIAQSGYQAAFGEMALISGVILLGFIPFFFWGKRIRHATWKWRITQKLAHWDTDREVVGESI